MKLTRLLLTLSFASALFAQTKYQTDVLALRPLGFWPLSGNANDVSGAGNNGSPTNGLFFSGLNTSPVHPQSAVFTGAKNQTIVMPTAGSSIFNIGALHAFSAMAWVKTTSQGNGGIPIISKFDGVAGAGWALVFDNSDSGDPGSSGQFGFVFAANNQITLAIGSTRALNDGAWHFLAVTYDGAGKASGVQLYIDGLPIPSQQRKVDTDAIGSNTSINNSAPLAIGGGAPVGFGGGWFDGYINGAAVFNVALTPAQILQLAEDGATAAVILSQFAVGGGWSSSVYFSNLIGASISFTVNFRDDHGNPLTVVPGGATQTINLGPFASAVIEAPNVGDLQQGYAYTFLPPFVIGYGVFRQSIPGSSDQEAVVPFAPNNTGNLSLVSDDLTSLTAVAMVNLSVNTSTVTITVSDVNGNIIATSAPIVLPPGNKLENVLKAFPGLAGIAGNRGKASFLSTGGPVSVLGLRFRGGAFTDIPSVPAYQASKFFGAP